MFITAQGTLPARLGRNVMYEKRWLAGLMMLAGAAAVYVLLSPNGRAWLVGKTKAPHLPRLKSFQRAVPWFQERRRQWAQSQYASLNDKERLCHFAVDWVQARAPGGPTIDEQALVQTLVDFFWSQGAPTPTEYLDRLRERRTLITNAANDRLLQACYREITGRTMPQSIAPRELLSLFWEGHEEALQRPVAVSHRAYVQVAQSRPAPPDSLNGPQTPLYVATRPEFSIEAEPGFFEEWAAPVSRAFLRLTRPRVELRSVIEKYGTTPVCKAGWILKTRDGSYGLVHVYLYYSPDDGVWYIETAWANFDNHTFWPL